jgi:hypothetical protein
MAIKSALAALWLSLIASSVHAAEGGFTAKVFDLKSREKLLFTQKNETEDKGDRHLSTSTFQDPEGKTALIEMLEIQKVGDKENLVSYKISQKQLGAEGSVEIKDGEAHFSFTRDGKTKTGKEKVSDNFVVGPTTLRIIRDKWGELMKGSKVKVRLAVLDRQETVGFEFSKVGEGTIEGQKSIDVKMKPSSFLIAALVNPLHFHMSTDGKRLLQLEGRSQTKQKDGDHWKDLDALTVYQYPTNAK